ncbi:MAG: dienelactone hydrolase family protein [Candidatus Binatia bacterium]
MAEKIKALIREYQKGKLSRREFMRQAIIATGSLAAANSLIGSLLPSSAVAAQVAPNDPEILTHNVQYDGKAGTVAAYLARPVKPGKYPAIIVISDNAGLVDHFRDVARRYAKEGYVALVPDVLSRHGGTAKANPKGTGLANIRELAPLKEMTENIDGGFTYLKVLPDVRGDRFGLTGFCWGGDMAFGAASQVRGLRALVLYYSRSPQPIELIKNVQAPVLAHYAGEDPGVNKGIPATEEAMKKYGRSFEYKIYPGARHAFFHDLRPDRYHPQAAKEAWARTLDFFKKNLKS